MRIEAAAVLARELMDRHGLADWQVGFDRAKTRAGVCRYADRRISLSGPLTLLHDPDEVRDTVLHEIAHALAGAEHGHDRVWQATARALGASAVRCLASSAPRVPGSWTGTCPAGHQVTRHRRPQRVSSCRRCSPTFDLRAVFEWSSGGRPGRMSAGYQAELARLRAAAWPVGAAGRR